MSTLYNACKARRTSSDIGRRDRLLQGSQNKTVDSGLVIHILFPLLSSTPPRYYDMTGVQDLWPAAPLLRVQLSAFISSIFSSSYCFIFNLGSCNDIIEIDLCYREHNMCPLHDDWRLVYPNTNDMKIHAPLDSDVSLR